VDDVVSALERPETTDTGHNNRKIAQAPIDERHVLRVVYEEYGETKRVKPFILVGEDVMRRVDYSPDVDALLIEFSEKNIDYAEDMGQFVVHFSEDGELVLLEILDAKDFLLEAFSNVLKKREAVQQTIV